MSISDSVREAFGGGLTPMQRAEGWASEIVSRLDRLIAQETGDRERVERVVRVFNVQIDAAGRGVVPVGFPPGVAWNLLKLTGGGSVGARLTLYLDAPDDASQIVHTRALDANPWTETLSPEGDYVPTQSTLYIVVTGAAPGSNVPGRLTAKAYRAEPTHAQDPIPDEAQAEGDNEE